MSYEAVESVSVRDVERELVGARAAIDRTDTDGALASLRVARRYLHRVPVAEGGEHVFAAFMAADRHLDEATDAVENAHPEQARHLRRALQSLQTVTVQLSR